MCVVFMCLVMWRARLCCVLLAMMITWIQSRGRAEGHQHIRFFSGTMTFSGTRFFSQKAKRWAAGSTKRVGNSLD